MFKITQNIKSAFKILFVVVFSSFIAFFGMQANASDEAFLNAGEKAVNSGQYDKAIGHLTKAIEAGSLSPESTAKAYYYRGLAYNNKNEPARSIADFTSALFFKKNPAALKSKILVARAKAYRAVGLVNRAENDIRASGSADTTIANVQRPVRQAQARPVRRKEPTAFDTIPTRSYNNDEPKPEKKPQALSQGWGASIKQAPVRKNPQRVASIQQPTRTVQSDRTTSSQQKSNNQNYRSWFENSNSREAPQRPVRRNNNFETTRQTPPARTVALSTPARVSGSGRFRLQLAAVSSENDARAAWARLVSQHSSLLSNQNPDFQTVNLGGSKSVVRIQIGPFADKLQTLQLCNTFKQNGLDCFLVVR